MGSIPITRSNLTPTLATPWALKALKTPPTSPPRQAHPHRRTAKGGGKVEIAFNKSTSEGVNIYCRSDGDPGPVFLARDTVSPYVDNRPLLVAGKPEVREYRALYVVADAEIGNPSDGAVITATP